ncbi:AMID-like oxidoreductase [Cladophialophora carrionii]|uniref:AMID-like oxidoreductase n=1 Tax=Cladophialophora carrionii TaxID=86049 RepID=A0A1C1D2B1_9EURO|nr:AMID-like oxidoreductase [Cladophialophora carrionii]
MSVHTVVIIGASFGGLTVAHGLLKNVFPQLPSGKESYKVVQIAPNEEFFWKIGAPRVIGNAKSLPLEKALIPIAPGFKAYPKEQYQFIKAYATSIDPSTKTVQTSTNDSIHYDSLVIASGTTFSSHLWTVTDGSEPLKQAVHEIHQKLPNAKTILVAGGGAAGVETAGELGEVYGHKKDITLLSGSTGLLTRLHNKKMGVDAQRRLEKMGVKVIHDSLRVTEHTTENGKEVLKLSNGETKTVDIYIEATGDKPNTKFVPQEWLDDKQRVKTDPHTLRLDVRGVTGVYVIGTVGSYSDGSVVDVKFATPAILESIKLDLQGKGGPRTNKIYKKIQSDMQFVPIGSQGGVGIAFGWKLPSFLVKMAKSKDFMIGDAVKTVEGTA